MSIRPIFPDLPIRLALGLLRLCGEDRPSEPEAIALIHRALDSGVRLLDTADVYCLDDKDLHYGERLARKAVESWSGPQSEIRILTKVGMTRPAGKWVPNGSRKHIRAAVERSLQALGQEQLFMLQLHVKDTRVPFEETLAALAELQQSGKVLHLGLCNVNPAEIRQASRHFKVACIQNELGVQSRKSAEDGSVELARLLGIPFLAYRPLGGKAKVDKLTKNRVLSPLAARLQAQHPGVTAQELALASLLGAGEHILALVGPSRTETLESCLRAERLQLDASTWETIRDKYDFAADPLALESLVARPIPEGLASLQPGQGPGSDPEVVIVMGIQGAGKSELVEAYQAHGYVRLNRDLEGGKLEDLLPRLEACLQEGQTRVVLDNTYPTRISRASVVSIAHRYRVPVRCKFLNTSIHEARINVVGRMLERHGKLLGPQEMKELARIDPNLPPPAAMKRWQDSFEPPEADEGFSVIDEVAFVRRQSQAQGKGLLLDVDGTLRTTLSGEIYPRHPDDVVLLPGRRAVLQRWIDDGYQLFFVSNQSGISNGHVSQEAAQAALERTAELLDLPIREMVFCPHQAFPVSCFCRKPMPGMGVWLMRRHQLSPQHLVMVGDMDSDAAFAAALGARYYDAAEFFAEG